MIKKRKSAQKSDFFQGFLNGLISSGMIAFITLLVLWLLL